MTVRHAPDVDGKGSCDRVLQESSVIGDYPDSWDKPGSSFLRVGEWHHFNREQVAELIGRMQHWLNTGRLAVDGEPVATQDEDIDVDTWATEGGRVGTI